MSNTPHAIGLRCGHGSAARRQIGIRIDPTGVDIDVDAVAIHQQADGATGGGFRADMADNEAFRT